MNEQILKVLLEEFTTTEFNPARTNEYQSILNWLKMHRQGSDVQVLGLIARAHVAAAKHVGSSEIWMEEARACVQIIKENRDAQHGHFGDPKHVHRTYFALKAIDEVEGVNSIDDANIRLFNWLKSIVNSDGGWAQERIVSTAANTSSDVESTATAIQTLAIMAGRGKTGDEIIRLIEGGVQFLSNSKGSALAWKEKAATLLDAHTTSHAIRALVTVEPFVPQRREAIRSVLKDSLVWIKKTQIEGGWGNDESDTAPETNTTALILASMNYIRQYDPSMLSPYSKTLRDTILYLWKNFSIDHWVPYGAYANILDSLQFTAIITRELVKLEWYLKDVPYYRITGKIDDMLTVQASSLQKHYLDTTIGGISMITFRGVGLLSIVYLIIMALSEVVSSIVDQWLLFEDTFKNVPILSNIIAGILLLLLTLGLGKMADINLRNLLLKYLGLNR